MRQFRLLFPVLVSAIAFAACSGGNGTSPTAGIPAAGPASPVSPDRSGTFSHGTFQVPTFTKSDPCPGGLDMTFGGSVAYNAFTIVGQDKTVILVRTKWVGLTGTDSNGNPYTFSGGGRARLVIPNGQVLHGAGLGHAVFVGSGPDAGDSVRVKVDASTDGNGHYSVTLDSVKFVCGEGQ